MRSYVAGSAAGKVHTKDRGFLAGTGFSCPLLFQTTAEIRSRRGVLFRFSSASGGLGQLSLLFSALPVADGGLP